MAPSRALALALALPRGSVCRSCLLACARGVAPIQRRNISTGWLRKTADAEAQWKERAQEVQDGKRPDFFAMLEERGYVKDTAG